ncbi:hypothetical protein ACQBAR_15805 [Propionibacteriaceae bacterium Y1685]|uniref:hypothetical protein n=1 Tax=Microlunatus sp. Y1700 TaxID=3418487 RepID=UPI003B8280D3
MIGFELPHWYSVAELLDLVRDEEDRDEPYDVFVEEDFDWAPDARVLVDVPQSIGAAELDLEFGCSGEALQVVVDELASAEPDADVERVIRVLIERLESGEFGVP